MYRIISILPHVQPPSAASGASAVCAASGAVAAWPPDDPNLSHQTSPRSDPSAPWSQSCGIGAVLVRITVPMRHILVWPVQAALRTSFPVPTSYPPSLTLPGFANPLSAARTVVGSV